MSAPNLPSWLIPSAPAMLSNFYGSNPGVYPTPVTPNISETTPAGAGIPTGSCNLPTGTYTFGIVTWGPRGMSAPRVVSQTLATLNDVIHITILGTGMTIPQQSSVLEFIFLTAAPAGVNLGRIPQDQFQQGYESGADWFLYSKTQCDGTSATSSAYDALPFSLRYSNPVPTSQMASARLRVLRVGRNGVRTTPEIAFDLGWVGNVATQPPSLLGTLSPHGAAYSPQAGRAYLMVSGGPTNTGTGIDAPVNNFYSPVSAASAAIISAPVSGASTGTWRLEAPLPEFGSSDAADPGGLCIVNGYLYAISGNALWNAPILGDGAVGAWQPLYTQFSAGAGTNVLEAIVGFDDGIGKGAVFVAVRASGSNNKIYGFGVNPDGSLTLGGTTTMPAFRTHGALYFDPSTTFQSTVGNLVYLGGQDAGSTDQNTIYYVTADSVAGTFSGAWTTSTATLPVAMHNFGIAPVGQRIEQVVNPSGSVVDNGQGGGVIIAGGASAGVAQTAIYTNHEDTPWYESAGHIFSVGSLPAAQATCSIIVPLYWPYITVVQPEALGKAGTPYPNSAVIFAPTVVYVINGIPFGPSSIVGSGSASPITPSSMGSSATVVTNADGTQDIKFFYGNMPFTEGLIYWFSNGDIIQADVWFTDQAGDPSPKASTLINIGQVPVIQNLSPASSGGITNGDPPVSFTYKGGAGGGPQLNWRARIFDKTSALIYDSGVLTNQQNNITPANLAPFLIPASSPFSVRVDTTSTDVPLNDGGNSSASANQTSTNVTLTGSAPATPTGVSASADNVNGLITVSWTNPGGSSATLNRVYYRKTGSTPWLLLKDNITSVIGSQQSGQFMDQLAFMTGYDFAVSAVSSTNIESAMATGPSGVTISPSFQFDLNGFHAMVHIAGFSSGVANGIAAANHVGLYLVDVPTFDRAIDSDASVAFGNVAPSLRYGTYTYRKLTIKLSTVLANIQSLDALLVFAQQNGSTLVYRDTVGTVIYCGLDAQNHQRTHDLYFNHQLSLIEQQYTYTP